MTTITIPPTPPSRNDPVNFPSRADTFLGALPTFATEVNLVAEEINTNTLTAVAQAGIATTAANNANSASIVSMSSVNFKGLWTSLTGALNKPASVKHNGRFWLLLNNLGNVTTSTPGVSADWTSMDAGIPISQVITTNTTAIPGVRYIIANPSITLTMPTSGLLKGDYVGIRLAVTPSLNTLVNFGSVKLYGVAVGSVYIDIKGFGLDLNYEDSTYGWN